MWVATAPWEAARLAVRAQGTDLLVALGATEVAVLASALSVPGDDGLHLARRTGTRAARLIRHTLHATRALALSVAVRLLLGAP